MSEYKVIRQLTVLATVEEEFLVTASSERMARSMVLSSVDNEEYKIFPNKSKLKDLSPIHKSITSGEVRVVELTAPEINF